MQPVLVRLGFWPLFFITAGSSLILYVAYRYYKFLYTKDGAKPTDAQLLRIQSLKSLSTTMAVLAAAVVAGFRSLRAPGGRFTIGSYGFMLAVAFFAGVYLAQKRGAAEGIPDRDISFLSIGIIAAALLGSKLFFYIFEKPPATLKQFLTFWRGGLVIYGGIITAALTAWFIIRKRNLPAGKIFDIFTPSIAIGIFFGRIGCFLAGCCYGNVTSAFTGVIFPAKAKVYRHLLQIGRHPEKYSSAWHNIPELFKPMVQNSPDSPLMRFLELTPFSHLKSELVRQQCTALPVHPAQLYSSLNGLLAFLLLSFLYKKKKFEGEIFLWFIVYYSATRFLIEATRIDTPHDLFFGAFSLSQALGLFLLPTAVFLIILLRRKSRRGTSHG